VGWKTFTSFSSKFSRETLILKFQLNFRRFVGDITKTFYFLFSGHSVDI